MSRLKFILQGLPYQGPPDGERKNKVREFVAKQLPSADGVVFRESGYSTDGVSVVQPDLAAYFDVESATESGMRAVVLRLAQAANSVGLTPQWVLVLQVESTVGHGIAIGGAAGTAAGLIVGGSSSKRETLVVGAVLGAVLGAILGGSYGSSLLKDGPLLGVWKAGPHGEWTWTSSKAIVDQVDIKKWVGVSKS